MSKKFKIGLIFAACLAACLIVLFIVSAQGNVLSQKLSQKAFLQDRLLQESMPRHIKAFDVQPYYKAEILPVKKSVKLGKTKIDEITGLWGKENSIGDSDRMPDGTVYTWLKTIPKSQPIFPDGTLGSLQTFKVEFHTNPQDVIILQDISLATQ